jgi:hypothetical protein
MLKRILAAWAILALVAVLAGCAVHVHKIGTGPAGTDVAQLRQWYILWGLVPLNVVDTATMAGTIPNYEIRTEYTPLDFVMNLFTGIVTINSRTVTVNK